MRPSPPFRRLAAALGLLAVGASNAGAAPPLRSPSPAAVAGGAPLRLRVAPWDASPTPRDEGIARTAVDRTFDGGSAKVAAGFLCGLTPTTVSPGGAGALGVDRDGRFLGAQLKLGFR